MKFNLKEIGTQKQYEELILCLVPEKWDETPEDTTKVILNIASKLRNSSKYYSENLDFLKKVTDFAKYHQNNTKILENCVFSMAHFGGLSKDKECREFCYNYLQKFVQSNHKKIKYYANTLIVNLYADILRNESDYFQFALNICDIAPKSDSVLTFAIFISSNIDWFDPSQLQLAKNAFEKYSKATKSDFDKHKFDKMVALLNSHINGDNKLKSTELLSLANDFAIKKMYG